MDFFDLSNLLRIKDCRSFSISVLKTLTGVDLKKVLSQSQNMVSLFSEPSVLKLYKAFQDRLTFLHRHMVVWIGWDS